MTALVNSAPATGSGTFTLTAPVSSNNQTLTLPDETGTLYSSATPVRTQKGVPAFSAYQSVAQSVTNAVVKIQFQAEEYDVTGAFDSTTNYRFQPTVAGYYLLNAALAIASATTYIDLRCYKNGSYAKAFASNFNASNQSFVAGSCQVYLNGSTDYVEVYASTGATINSIAQLQNTYFQGILIAAA
jgi:hypothetical protein